MKTLLFRCIGLVFLTGVLATPAAAFTPPAGMVERAQMGQWVYQPTQQPTITDKVAETDIGYGITLSLPDGCCRYYDQEETARLLAGTRLMAPDTVSFGDRSGAWVVTLNTQTHDGAAPGINRQIGPFVIGTEPQFIRQSEQGGGYWLNEFTEEARQGDRTFIRHTAVFGGHGRLLRAELIAPRETYAQGAEQFAHILRNLRFDISLTHKTIWKKITEAEISVVSLLQAVIVLILLNAAINMFRTPRAPGAARMAKRLGRFQKHKPRLSTVPSDDISPFSASSSRFQPPVLSVHTPWHPDQNIYGNVTHMATGTDPDYGYAYESARATVLRYTEEIQTGWRQRAAKRREAVQHLYADPLAYVEQDDCDHDEDASEDRPTSSNDPEDRDGYGKLKLPPRKDDATETEPAKILYIGIGTKGIHTLNRAMRSDMPGVDFMAIGHDKAGNVMDTSPAYLKLREDPNCLCQEIFSRSQLQNDLHQMMRAYKLIVVVADSDDNICICYVPLLAEIAKKHNHLLTVMLTMPVAHTLSLIREQPVLQWKLQQSGVSHICFTGPMMRRVLGRNLNSRQFQIVRMSWINMTIWAYAQLARDKLSLQSLKRRLQRGKQGYFAYKAATGTPENDGSMWSEAAENLARSPFLADPDNFGGSGILMAISGSRLDEQNVDLCQLKETVDRRLEISTTREIHIPEMKGNEILLLLSYLYY